MVGITLVESFWASAVPEADLVVTQKQSSPFPSVLRMHQALHGYICGTCRRGRAVRRAPLSEHRAELTWPHHPWPHLFLQEADGRILQALLEKEDELQRVQLARREQALADAAWMKQVIEEQLQLEKAREAELQLLLR